MNRIKIVYQFIIILSFALHINGIFAQTCNDIGVNVTLAPTHIVCPDNNTGSVDVIVTGGSIIEYEWSEGVSELEPTDLYAGSYELTMTINNDDDVTCSYSEIVEITEPLVEVELDINHLSGCHTEDGFVILERVIQNDHIQTDCTPTNAVPDYPTDGWIEISGIIDTDEAYTISAGQQVVLTEDALFKGQLIINGGFFVIKGSLEPVSIDINPSADITIYNYGNLNTFSNNTSGTNEFLVSQGSVFINYGSVTIGNLNLEGTLENIYGDLLCENLSINVSGSLENAGDFIVNQQLVNNAIIVNSGELQVDGDFINNSELTNDCRIDVLTDLHNTEHIVNNGDIEVSNNTINYASSNITIEQGSGIFTMLLENRGTIQGNGGDCYILAVTSESNHFPGSALIGNYQAAPGNCLADGIIELDANFILPNGDGSGRSKVLYNLDYGWHDTEIEYWLVSGQQCIINQEVFIDGGISVHVNEDQAICFGDEIPVFGEINLNTENTEEQYNYIWDTKGETIIDDDGEGSIILSPQNSVNVEFTGEVADGVNGTCSETDDIEIMVIPQIVVTNNSAGGDEITMCSNESYEFNLSVTPTETEFIYNWSPETGLSNPHILNPVVSISASAVYTLSVINADNFRLSGFDIFGIYSAGEITDIEIIEKLYEVSDILFATEGEFEAGIIHAIGSTSANEFMGILKQHATNGCSVAMEYSFDILQAPKVSIAGQSDNITLCGGDQISIEATSDLSPDDMSWSWSPTDGLNDPAISNPVADASEPVVYTVTGTASNACKDETNIEINIYPDNVTVGIDEKGCLTLNPGEKQLFATGGISYNWSPQTGLSNHLISNPVLLPDGLNEYTLTVTVSHGEGAECEITKVLQIDNTSWPNAGEDINYCLGTDQEIRLDASGGRAGTYTWTPSTGIEDGLIHSPNPVIQLKSSVKYTLEAENEYGCKNTDEVVVTVDPGCRCTTNNAGEGVSYQWLGSISTDWNTPENWYSLNPGGIPGYNPTDNIIIESGNFNCTLDMDRNISNICVVGGELDLNGYILSASGEGTFTGGVISGQLTNGEAPLQMTNPDLDQSVYFNGTQFHCKVSILNYPEIYLNGSEFFDMALFELNGTERVVCEGGNTYHEDVTFSNTGPGDWYLAASNNGSKDNYTKNAIFKNNGTGSLFPSAFFTDTYKGSMNFEISDGEIVFGELGGIVEIANKDDHQYIRPVQEVGLIPVFKKLVITKLDAEISYLKLEYPIMVGKVPDDDDDEYGGYLEFINGDILTNSTSLLIIAPGVTIKGANEENHVIGPVKKIGDENFSFPVGSNSRFMPISILGRGTSTRSTEAEYIACFIEKQQNLGLPVDPLKYISECEYWTLTKSEEAPGLKIGLSWDNASCGIPIDSRSMHVAYFDGINWASAGGQDYMLTGETSGTFTSDYSKSISVFQAFAIGSDVIPGTGPMIGLTFNNYGAIVNIIDESAILKVDGNILHEKGKTQDLSKIEGRFHNEGQIILSKDWTNNNTNQVFTESPEEGLTVFKGNYQRIRGTQPTTFWDLTTKGYGKKEIFNYVRVQNILDVTITEFSTNNYCLDIRNPDVDAIQFNTGFISTKKTGTLKWALSPNENYFFPLGRYKKFRPIEIITTGLQTDTLSYLASFIDNDPTTDGYLRKHRAINISELDSLSYYRISAYEEARATPVDLTLYFNKITDDSWQNISSWDEKPEVVPEILKDNVYDYMWKKGGAVTSVLANESDNGLFRGSPKILEAPVGVKTNDILLKQLQGEKTMPYSLSKSGLVINTAAFGNPFERERGIAYTLKSNEKINGGTVFTGDPDNSIHVYTIDEETGNTIHQMQLQDNMSINGQINFTTGPNGQILKDENGDYNVTFTDENGQEHLLSPDLYEIPEGFEDVFILKDKPDELRSCDLDKVKIYFSHDNPIVLSINPLQFGITGIPEDDQNLSMKILYGTQLIKEIVGYDDIISYDWSDVDNNGEGAYNFELKVSVVKNDIPGTHVFKGQFFYYQ